MAETAEEGYARFQRLLADHRKYGEAECICREGEGRVFGRDANCPHGWQRGLERHERGAAALREILALHEERSSGAG